jgi:hypothetical protein
MLCITFDCAYKIRNEIGTALITTLQVAPHLIHRLVFRHEAIVLTTAETNEDNNDCKDNPKDFVRTFHTLCI